MSIIVDIPMLCESMQEEELKKIEEWANKLMSVHDIAILIGMAPETMTMAIKEGNNAIAMAYNHGKARRVLDMHEKEIELAEAGSAQAIENLHKFLNKMDASEE